MSPKIAKIISWSPILALLALLLLVWVLIGRSSSEEGGRNLLRPACPEEQVESISQGSFEIIYRAEGCKSVPSGSAGQVGNWTREWESLRKEISLPSLTSKTVIDIRPKGTERVFWKLGRPGAIILPNLQDQGKHNLFSGLNELALREAFPKAPPREMSLLGRALAARIYPGGSIRLVLSGDVRQLADSLPSDWAKQLTQCQGLCLRKLSR